MKPVGLYLIRADALDEVYGPTEQAEAASLLELPHPPQSPASIRSDPSPLGDVEVLLAGWGLPRLDAELLEHAPRLRLVLYGGGSTRPFVTPELWSRGIRVVTARAANSLPVADFTLAVILFSLKHGWRMQGQTRVPWEPYPPAALMPGSYGSTVGLLSLGSVGRLVRERLRPFDLNVLACDPALGPGEARGLDVRPVGLKDLFVESDVVSVHTPLLDSTIGLVTGELITSMPLGGTFINTARGGIARERELIAALEARTDLQAVLDVTEHEPLAADSKLRQLPNVVLTPHIAGAMGRERRRLGRLLIGELKRYLAGEPLEWEVGPAESAAMGET
jgi:phosphoglycerate dehydrogenase-like enzyme